MLVQVQVLPVVDMRYYQIYYRRRDKHARSVRLLLGAGYSAHWYTYSYLSSTCIGTRFGEQGRQSRLLYFAVKVETRLQNKRSRTSTKYLRFCGREPL